MPGYWIVKGGAVKDEAALKAHNDLFAPIAQRYGVEIIAGSGLQNARQKVSTPFAKLSLHHWVAIMPILRGKA